MVSANYCCKRLFSFTKFDPTSQLAQSLQLHQSAKSDGLSVHCNQSEGHVLREEPKFGWNL